MKTFRNITIVLILFFGSLTLYGQQAPMYTHYMNNILVINPAYAGSRDALSVTALHRSQWVGFSGAPITQSLTMHTPFKKEFIGIGLSVINDNIGPTNNTSVFFDYSFILKISEKSKLALGLSGGVNIYQANLSSIELDQQNDPAFDGNIENKLTPNFGLGVFYSRERFFAGISSPFILQNTYTVKNRDNVTSGIAKEQRHYYIIAGTQLKLTDKIALRPSSLIKITKAAPVEADFTASFIFMKKLLIGAMYRTGDAIGCLVGMDITNKLHLGYSFDWSYGLKTSDFNQGSHELVFRYDFKIFNKEQEDRPIYF
ncbi:MAG: PorP/SprF family type IX secretion system membrane protein [Bacteroidota bacterium]